MPPKFRGFRYLLLLTLLAGALLRFWSLGQNSLWKDELFSAVESKKSFLELLTIKSYGHYGYAPVHYLFTHLAQLFGSSDFIIRAPTVIFGILSILLTYYLIKSIYEKNAGLLAAFLLAISTLHIQYSREVRYYSYLVFFSGLTLLASYKIVAEKKKIRWILLFLVSTVINLATQLTALLILVSEVAFFTIMLAHSLFKNKNSFKRLNLGKISLAKRVTLVLFVVMVIAVTFKLVGSFSEFLQSATLKPAMPLIDAFGYIVVNLSGDTRLAFLLLPLFIIGVISAFLQNKDGATILSLTFLLPILSTYFFRSPTNPGFLIRYIIYILISYLSFVAIGLLSLRKLKPIFFGLLGLIILLSLLPLKNYFRSSRGDWRGVAEYIRNNSDRGDVVITDGDFNTMLLDYYLKSEQNGLTLKKPTEPLDPPIIPFHVFYFQHDYQKPDGTPNPNEVFLSNPQKIISFPADISPMHIFLSNSIYYWREAEEPLTSFGWAPYNFYGQKLLHIDSADLVRSIVTYRVEVPLEGRYFLFANLRRDNTPGKIQFRLDDGKWSSGFQPIWDGTGARTKEYELGTLDLTTGEHTLSFKNQSNGQTNNDQAIDYFYLTLVE